jgi:hypothetical protein
MTESDVTITQQPAPTPEKEPASAELRQPPVKRSRGYWRLLLLVPGAFLLAFGLFNFYNFPEGGTIESIKLTTKPGLVGQASEAVKLIDPRNPDLYLKVFTTTSDFKTKPYDDTPVGNGLVWSLRKPIALGDFKKIEVWDSNSIVKDREEDNITMGDWSAEGQHYHIDLLGKRNQPPPWALPLAVIGGAICGFVVLRFVWDQVI